MDSAAHITSAFVKEAFDRGAELFRWDERKARSGPAPGDEGPRHRRRRRPAWRGLDWLRRPDDDSSRREALRPVGRRQSRHPLVHRSRARRRRHAGDALGQGGRQLGQHGKEHSVVGDVGRQPDDARDDEGESGGRGRRAVEAAGDCREGSRRRANRLRARRRARLPARQPVTRASRYAQAAARAIALGGKYDGHELPGRHPCDDEGVRRRARGLRADGRRQGHLSARRRHLFVRRRLRGSRGGCRDGQDAARRLSRRRRCRHRDQPAQPARPDPRRHQPGYRACAAAEVRLRPAVRRGARQALLSQQAADDPRHPGR